jgi:fumarylacetoacetase
MNLNLTHDPSRRSWIDSANRPDTDFPLQNLPFGVFRPTGTASPLGQAKEPQPRIGVAIGERVLDLKAAADEELLPDSAVAACREPNLNALMAAGPTVWANLRATISELLGEDTCLPGDRQRVSACLVSQRNAQMLLPARIGDYTDFYASVHHATNVGSMLRPDNPLLPNYKWMPIGYHGRASSIVVSGTLVRRPHGQLKAADAAVPAYAPCRNLDYELEMGAFIGPGNAMGERIPIGKAADHIFGYVLLNDWSARDIQTW